MSWFAFALAAGLASAINVWASKALLARADRPILVGGVVHVWGALFCLTALSFVPLRADWSVSVGAGLLGMGLIYSLANALYFLALRQAELSEIDLFLRTTSLWTFLLGLVLLDESASMQTLLGMVLIVGSVLLLSHQKHPLLFNRPQLLALAAALAFGAGNITDKWLSSSFDALSYTALNLSLTGLGMLFLARPRVHDLAALELRSSKALLVGLTFATTQMLIILAFTTGGSAGEVILVAQARLLILIAVGISVFRERERLGRKLTAACLMSVGIATLYTG